VTDSIRINRFLADSGLGSRRYVEELVRKGRIELNGAVVTELGTRIDPTKDVVFFDGKKLSDRQSGEDVWLFHKPLNCLCTRDDPKGRKTIFSILKHLPPPYQAVGRLDQNSTGLLLITRRGELAQSLMHPKYEISKKYEVMVMGKWNKEKEAKLKEGVMMREGGEGKAIVLDTKPIHPTKTFLALELKRGKKREIRYSMEALGMKVTALHRIALGDLKLGPLKAGESRALKTKEVQALESLIKRL